MIWRICWLIYVSRSSSFQSMKQYPPDAIGNLIQITPIPFRHMFDAAIVCKKILKCTKELLQQFLAEYPKMNMMANDRQKYKHGPRSVSQVL